MYELLREIAEDRAEEVGPLLSTLHRARALLARIEQP